MTLHYLFIFTTLLFFAGCSGNQSYFLLSTPTQPKKVYHAPKLSIGVQHLTLPDYMKKHKLTIATSNSAITQIESAVWGEDLDNGLKHRMISFLQKKFQNPQVYLYPWSVYSNPTVTIDINIHRFVPQNERVYLDASWTLYINATHKNKAYRFAGSLPFVSQNPADIVDAMHRTFGLFEESVAGSITINTKETK